MSQAFCLPAQLNGLTDREAIADALYRVVLAFDHADEELLKSAFATDKPRFEMPGHVLEGIPEMKAAVFDRVSKLDTTHFLSNIRVNIQSPTTAQATCSAMAQHAATGKGVEGDGAKLTSGGFYYSDMIKEGDLWKIQTWRASFVWLVGDRSVMAGEEQ